VFAVVGVLVYGGVGTSSFPRVLATQPPLVVTHAGGCAGRKKKGRKYRGGGVLGV